MCFRLAFLNGGSSLGLMGLVAWSRVWWFLNDSRSFVRRCLGFLAKYHLVSNISSCLFLFSSLGCSFTTVLIWVYPFQVDKTFWPLQKYNMFAMSYHHFSVFIWKPSIWKWKEQIKKVLFMGPITFKFQLMAYGKWNPFGNQRNVKWESDGSLLGSSLWWLQEL